MPKYDYKCPVHGEFEAEHSIDFTLGYCPIQAGADPCEQPLKKLLSPVPGRVVGGTPKHYR